MGLMLKENNATMRSQIRIKSKPINHIKRTKNGMGEREKRKQHTQRSV